MSEQIQVVYENGVFRPLFPLSDQFREHQRLTVTIQEAAAADDWLADADSRVSLEAVREALAKVPGTLADLIRDERNES
jgi:predicted DNA-binding antitoxin AbrB/MazE fold protein